MATLNPISAKNLRYQSRSLLLTHLEKQRLTGGIDGDSYEHGADVVSPVSEVPNDRKVDAFIDEKFHRDPLRGGAETSSRLKTSAAC